MRKATAGLALLGILAVLLSGCGGGGGGGDKTPTPAGCPSNPSENGEGCPQFELASPIYEQICSSKGGSVTYLRDNSTCCLQEIMCLGDGGYIFQINIRASTECLNDSGCKVAGCSSQYCAPLYEDPVGTCDWLPEYECFNMTSCGCNEGICSWAETAEYISCVDKATGRLCPESTPMTREQLLACEAEGGAPIALPDPQGCFNNPACSTSISCELLSYNCPDGFICNATLSSPSGACKKGQDYCGGAKNVSCPRGSRCEIMGSYAGSSGVCRRLCDDGSGCANGTECVGGACIPVQNRACSESSPCPKPFACQGGICTLAEGRFCNSTTIPCPAGYRCDMSAGTGATGSCEPFCGGAEMARCGPGEACITTMRCNAGETCLGYEGVCSPRQIPDSLALFCNRQLGNPLGTVIGFQKCPNSSLFIMSRTGNEFAYVHADGRIERECGASGLRNDPECASLKNECGKPSASVLCSALEVERFMLCPPAFSASPNCPASTEEVCAKLMVGMNPALRSPEWRTFKNGCEACNANNPGQIAIGYWRGAC